MLDKLKPSYLSKKWLSLEARGISRPKDSAENRERAMAAHNYSPVPPPAGETNSAPVETIETETPPVVEKPETTETTTEEQPIPEPAKPEAIPEGTKIEDKTNG